jgi:hypothetical protein
MFLTPLGMKLAELDVYRKGALLRHARLEKEGISRDPEREWLELAPGDYALTGGVRPRRILRIPVSEYYDRIRPKISGAVQEMKRVIEGPRARSAGIRPEGVDAIYLVGGSSRLPLIGTMMREQFPKIRVISSDRPFSSIAMGAAIVASDRARISDIISRHFGVIRLRESGQKEYFSPIFNSGTRLPRKGEPPLEIEVAYNPQHNIGHLQYLECSRLGNDDLPDGEARRWSDVLFPYDPSIPPERPLVPSQVEETNQLSGTQVVERYWCDSDGVITVKLERRADGQNRTFEISRE